MVIKIVLLIPRPRMDHEVFMFDVGHGDCVLISDDKDQGLLVDCGALKPQKYFKVPQFVEYSLLANNMCGFVVSHYHWDHYSLFRRFKHPDALFSKLYLPNLPIRGPGREAALAIMDYLKVAIFSDFLYYRILPEMYDLFIKTGRPIVFCKKGVIIDEASLRLKVFWPDLYHPSLGSKRVKEKASAVRKIIEPLMERYDIPKPSRYDTAYSIEKFFQDLRREELRYRKSPEQIRGEIYETLEQVERDFSDLANIFSIAFRTYYKRRSRFLFLGDLTDDLLDQIIILGNRRYECLKAAHHGTTFGRALRNMSTEFLLVSRSQREFPNIKEINDGYISKMRYQMLLSTEFLGDCYIC